jgi:rod shape determining protein RodA
MFVTGGPIALILLQPDLGTVLVYLAILVSIVVVAGVQARMITLLALVAITGTIAVFQSDVLEGYQEKRLTVFLFDTNEIDAEAEIFAYNAEQAKIAIGNGGLTGEGLFQGTQTRSELVPEQQTDFIFTVAGEELGFRGAGFLLGLYALLLYRIWRTAQNASSLFGRLLCTGVFAMFLFQIFQSVGMTMGMMPITGIPLPLVSYGGSSMLTSMLALGLVAGVHRRRYEVDHRG